MAKNENPEKKTKTHVDTICFTRKEAEGWAKPELQRELKVTPKVVEVSEEIKRTGGVIPGIITLGKLKSVIYLLDGLQRMGAFFLTELPEGYADVRTVTFETEAEMADEFISLNSHIVTFKPDDFMRGLEKMCPPVAYVKKNLPYVGYDMIRRGPKSPILSMSLLLRTWVGSVPEVPKTGVGSAQLVARSITMEDAKLLVKVVNHLYSAWGRGDDTKRLWSTLNLVLCFWLYRRLVHAPPSAQKRSVKLTEDEFEKCMMALGASSKYCDWLTGRNFNERDRNPAFQRIKEIIARRLMDARGLSTRPLLPQPSWATGHARVGIL